MKRGELSPLDGRYAKFTEMVRNCSSERTLVRRRIVVEVRYLIKLIETLNLTESEYNVNIEDLINLTSVDRVFELEEITKHDVKAVELAIREALLSNFPDSAFAARISPFIHFGLTSQDINSACVTLECRDLVEKCILPSLDFIINELNDFSYINRSVIMLSRTHGQPATPTTLGKEFAVFTERLHCQIRYLKNHQWSTKFGGATGGFNAHHYVYPNINWKVFADEFLQKEFQLYRQQSTTQIEHYDGLSAVFDAVKRINVILIDFCSDVWHYISLGYLKQSAVPGSVGSSTMPHKINPIQFENAEGNLQFANAMLEFMSRKLPISRMQRDLTDSTVTRNIGSAFGYTMIGLQNISNGIKTIAANNDEIGRDLLRHPEVITEGLQSLMRSDGYNEAYEKFHVWLRSKSNVTLDNIREFILKECEESVNIKVMLNLTPEDYQPI